MSSRLLGRLVTGPIAFLLAGVTDFVVYGIASLRRSIRSRR
jgi:hypothetical protein